MQHQYIILANAEPLSSSGPSSEPGIMRRERCCRWTGAWFSSAAALLVKTSIASCLVVCCRSSPPAAHPNGPATAGGGVLTSRTTGAAVGEVPCDYYVEQEAVAGLEFCPQLKPLRPLLLENKRRLLRLALDAVDGKPQGGCDVFCF